MTEIIFKRVHFLKYRTAKTSLCVAHDFLKRKKIKKICRECFCDVMRDKSEGILVKRGREEEGGGRGVGGRGEVFFFRYLEKSFA